MGSAGIHLIIDGYVKDSKKVFDATYLTDMFRGLVDTLGMQIIRGPDYIEVDLDPEVLRRSRETGIFEDEGGISMHAIISTSHIHIHAWPLQNFFSLDVFSCKPFDAERARNILEDALGIVSSSVTILDRTKPPEPY